MIIDLEAGQAENRLGGSNIQVNAFLCYTIIVKSSTILNSLQFIKKYIFIHHIVTIFIKSQTFGQVIKAPIFYRIEKNITDREAYYK